MARHYNEQAYNDASQQTKGHRRLHQTDSSKRKLMSMPRKVQHSICRLNMRCPAYSQVTTSQLLRCRWCDEYYNSITEQWLRNWQELMTAILTAHKTYLDDRDTTIAILNSQLQYSIHNSLQRNHMTFTNFPLPVPNS